MESKPLFISYNHDDRKEMLAIKQALLDAGLDIWTDESLKPGTQIWADSIEKAIRNCAAVVLILTPNTVDAKWVKRELMFADEHGVKIFPVHLHGTDQETSMLAISANQKTILRAYFDKSLKKEKGKKTGKDFQKDPKWVQLLEELSQLASKPVEQTKEFKGSLFRSIPFVVSAGVILLALIALSVLGKNSLVSDLFGSPTATLTSTNTQEILVPTDTVTATVTSTPTETLTPTPSNTPTITLTPTLTPTPLPTSGDVFTNPIDESPYVFVSEGKFWMGVNTGAGDEAKPRHEVYLDAYLIGQTEVTNGMYARCVMAGACSVPANGYYGLIGYSEYPINFINWSDARTYCKWAGGDLPTEAQWEKAARGGLEGQPYPWGDTNPSCLAGTTGANYGPCGENGPVAVGSYLSNGYNLYDMAGNLWEWVRDYYNEDYYEVSPEINPQGAEEPTSPLLRVLRGGSWDDILNYLWVANRGSSSSTSETKIIGFRCVISPQLVIQSDSP